MPAACALAQEMEPRAYSASPVDTNFALVNVTRLHGSVLPDPSVPITDVAASIDAQTFGYVRTFGVGGHAASLGVALPLVQGDVSGNVVDAPTAVHRAGPGDMRVRFALGLIGSPALSAAEFARRTPETSLGASLTVIAPTGRYRPERLVNVGSNRWAIKPELGLSQPLGKWFVETSLGVWLYGENDEYFGGSRREQDPLALVQLHAGYNFRPGMWLATDLSFSSGGRSRVDGLEKQDRQQNSRYGLTFSLPLGSGWSMKFAWARGLVTRVGGNFESVGVSLQRAWGSQ
ncbi:transporter [Noviherbaspirillum sp. DKR-6]|uniref:Transporter n=2 Tax=Noviherbaspirillum pedocola TaxID=2801341 RepID=A0A934W993_9BURK|nr:transporter [Noviherbaspirillum pedocola]